MRAPSLHPGRLLAAVVVTEVVWIATRGRWPGASAWIPLLAAVTSHGALVVRERRDPQLAWRSVGAAIALVSAAAVATAPAGSRDLFQYAFYGRMAGPLGADPYAIAPAAFSHDPLFASLAPGWHHARSVYGPAFTWFSAIGARCFATSALGARLWFQGAAALALFASAHRLRRDVSVAAALGVGLSPVLVATVNGGHNDLIVGWLVLVAFGPALRRHPERSGAVLGLATCVKVSALPVLVALAAVAAHRRSWRPMAALLGGWGAISVAGYALGGGRHLLGPLSSIGGRTSRASAWAVVERAGGSSSLTAAVISTSAIVAAGLVGIVAWRWRGTTAAAAATAVGAAASFAAPYVLAWYPATVIPVSGRAASSRATSILHIGASALLLAYVVPAGSPAKTVALAPAAAVACGLVLAVLVASLVVSPPQQSGCRRRDGSVRAGARRSGPLRSRMSFRLRTHERV